MEFLLLLLVLVALAVAVGRRVFSASALEQKRLRQLRAMYEESLARKE